MLNTKIDLNTQRPEPTARFWAVYHVSGHGIETDSLTFPVSKPRGYTRATTTT